MTSVIIVAAGKGARMGAGADKLFLKINRREIVAHTWTTFDRAAGIGEVILVVRDGMQSAFDEMAKQNNFKKPFRLVAAQPVTDTIKESPDGNLIERNLERSRLWAVQTPQTFRVEVIRRALAEVRRKSLLVTDDTAACDLK